MKFSWKGNETYDSNRNTKTRMSMRITNEYEFRWKFRKSMTPERNNVAQKSTKKVSVCVRISVEILGRETWVHDRDRPILIDKSDTLSKDLGWDLIRNENETERMKRLTDRPTKRQGAKLRKKVRILVKILGNETKSEIIVMNKIRNKIMAENPKLVKRENFRIVSEVRSLVNNRGIWKRNRLENMIHTFYSPITRATVRTVQLLIIFKFV